MLQVKKSLSRSKCAFIEFFNKEECRLCDIRATECFPCSGKPSAENLNYFKEESKVGFKNGPSALLVIQTLYLFSSSLYRGSVPLLCAM